MSTDGAVTAAIQRTVDQTPFVDTHEHLIEESRRLAPPRLDDGFYPCDDWSYLFQQYAADDLRSAGLREDDAARIFASTLEPRDKWALFEPYYRRARNTGYCQAVEHTVRILFHEEGIHGGNVERITEKMRALARTGFYYTVLRDVANIHSCQVHSLEYIFCETAYPDLLLQDLSIVPLSTLPDLQSAHAAGVDAATLDDWHGVIDWYFATFGPRAIAVKNNSAYWRGLDFDPVPADEAAPLFARFARDQESLTPPEHKALQDHLVHYSVTRATEYHLPVKLHCGYFAGTGEMPLDRVRRNATDLCPLLRAHPDATFILMHIGYPYQDEFIALAKHYRNAYLDMCWAWIVNPLAGVRFLKEALMAVPAAKILGFGGDYCAVEPVVGHAHVARQGITRALADLVADRWLSADAALEVARQVMRDNALAVFDVARAQAQGCLRMASL